MRRHPKHISFVAALVLFLAILGLPSAALADPEADSLHYVNDLSDLLWISEQVASGQSFENQTFLLQSDIDVTADEWAGIGWNLNHYFSGTFDGQGHCIRGLRSTGAIDSYTIINTPRHSIGLFGLCNGATICNLVVEDAHMSIENTSGYSHTYASINGTCVYAGAVAGYAVDTTFTNVTVRNSEVSASVGAESSHAYGGGLVGYAQNCDFAHCGCVDGGVCASSDSMMGDAYVGGLVGELVGSATVRQSFSTCDVRGAAQLTCDYAGGLVGKTTSGSSDAELSVIRDSYVWGTVSHDSKSMEKAFVGGIVGNSSSSVLRCYASGAVSVGIGGWYVESHVGGIAGGGIPSSLVSSCATICSSLEGGSCFHMSGAGSKENNLSVAGLQGTGDEDRTEQRESFYYVGDYRDYLGWDFSTIWEIVDTSLPTLRAADAGAEQVEGDLQSIIDSTSIVLAQDDTFDSVTQDFELVNGSDQVSWSTSNSSVISLESNNGHVMRQDGDYLVRVVATATVGDQTRSKTYKLRVLGNNTDAPEQDDSVGLPLEQARRFVSIMRNTRISNIEDNDPDVQVLMGKSLDEDQIASTMADVLAFMDVPGETEWLRKQTGDLVKTLKSGADSEMSQIISEVTGVSLTVDSATGEADARSLAEATAKAMLSPFRMGSSVMDTYNLGKGIVEYKPDDDEICNTLTWGAKAEKFAGLVTKHALEMEDAPSVPIGCGKILSWYKNAEKTIGIINSVESTARNAISGYLNQYMNVRRQFSSAEDSVLRDILMEAYSATDFMTDSEDMREFAETIYLLQQKFCKSVDDEYKVVIRCPVDVYVYDESGREVARVVNNAVDGIDGGLYATVGGPNGDEKTVYLEGDEQYSMQLVGNDEGSMTIDVVFDEGDRKRIVSYNDVSLTAGRSMAFDVSRADFSGDNVGQAKILEVADGVVDTTAGEMTSQSNGYLLTVTPLLRESDATRPSVVGGNAIGKFVEAGTPLTEIIAANDGYYLEGLFEDQQGTIPCAFDYMPEASLSVYAVFVAGDQQPTIDSGKCGKGTTWSLDAHGALNITGEGAVTFDGANAPWQEHLEQIHSVSIGVGITSVPEGVLAGCSVLESLDTPFIGLSREAIGKGAVLGAMFGGCSSGGVVQYHELDGSSLSGYRYDIPSTLRAVRILDATRVSFGALSFCDALEEVELNDGILEVDSYAFRGCSGLVDLTIPKSVTSVAEYALMDCTGLERLSVPFVGSRDGTEGSPDSVFGVIFGRTNAGVSQRYMEDGTSWYAYAYGIPSSLKQVEVSVTDRLPYGAFSGCSNLEQVILNKSLTTIGRYAFSGCSSLRRVIFDDSEQQWNEVEIGDGNEILGDSAVVEFKTSSYDRDGWVNLDSGAKGYAKGGKLVVGWMNLGSSKYYFQTNGSMSVGWTDVVMGDKTMHYYFNPASGNLVRDTWFQIDGKTYYFRPSGNLATGWATISDNGVDKKYYLDESGQLLTGWQTIEVNGKQMRYYFRPAGSMATGWATIDGEKYFFRESGNMATGWATMADGTKRYFHEDGTMHVGWLDLGGKTYYFRDPSGSMATGKVTIDGVAYEFSDSGTLRTSLTAQGEGTDPSTQADGPKSAGNDEVPNDDSTVEPVIEEEASDEEPSVP